MKLKYLIGICLFCFFTGIPNLQSKVPVFKVERAYKYVPELIIKDSLFLLGIDSLIFNSFCPEIKRGKTKIFDIYSEKRKNYFDLIFSIAAEFQYYEYLNLGGYFEYKNYLFIWYGPVPEYLCKISGNKKKLFYMKVVPIIKSDSAEFSFEYTQGKMELTGMCCF
ncbi:hypothetical protein OCV73_01220 [Barnesiella propionica]|uniref:hypothetical protein n=1 Tax=Barnesiella propionica TaxID=2981781 RepID=UPI0011C852EC|nr:hypothetical protein [Barnesiella propionica]MCU6767582.1 hypothetical protein [Barnesiella propionica]